MGLNFPPLCAFAFTKRIKAVFMSVCINYMSICLCGSFNSGSTKIKAVRVVHATEFSSSCIVFLEPWGRKTEWLCMDQKETCRDDGLWWYEDANFGSAIRNTSMRIYRARRILRHAYRRLLGVPEAILHNTINMNSKAKEAVGFPCSSNMETCLSSAAEIVDS